MAWSLEQTKYFTLGCPNLLVVTDHKPLVLILGDRTLDQIANTCLFRLKQRTLPWHFSILHMPGVSNKAADATSRHPSQYPTTNFSSIIDEEENSLSAAISKDVTDATYQFLGMTFHQSLHRIP